MIWDTKYLRFTWLHRFIFIKKKSNRFIRSIILIDNQELIRFLRQKINQTDFIYFLYLTENSIVRILFSNNLIS